MLSCLLHPTSSPLQGFSLFATEPGLLALRHRGLGWIWSIFFRKMWHIICYHHVPLMAVRYPPLTDSLGSLLQLGLSHRCKYKVAPCTLKKTGYTLLVQCVQNWNISKLCREKQRTASWQMYIVYIYVYINKLAQLCNQQRKVPARFQDCSGFSGRAFSCHQSPAPEIESQQIRCWE